MMILLHVDWLRSLGLLVVCFGLCTTTAGIASGGVPPASPRVLPAGTLPADKRLGPLKDLNGYFPFVPPKSREAWAVRAEQVRRRMLVALGLWPMPTKTPLNAVIHGRIDQGDYTVEKVCFESFPGFYVTGNLYRPKGGSGRSPGVLCPHGHWPKGRFLDAGEEAVRKQIAQGAERFEDGGRSPLQSRCVQLARMGCVVFHYDMIGYADCDQIPRKLAHGFSKQRPEMNTHDNWGLFSPQAESHLQSVMGMQTYNSIRALDFLTALPDVDPDRIAVTGASGGGTQTFILSALDPRVRVSVPAVMVSTAMQGGCTCENACLLRIGTGNVEFAALFAPGPLCLTAANDWTREMDTKGFPQLAELFKMLGVSENVELHHLTQFGHNYNYVSRSAMYAWLNRHLKLEIKTPIVETAYPRLSADQLTVWDGNHPRPAGGEDFERQVLRWWFKDAEQQLAALIPTDNTSFQRFRQVVGGAVDVLIGQPLPDSSAVAFAPAKTSKPETCRLTTGLLRNRLPGSELPCVLLEPEAPSGKIALWLDPAGKSAIFGGDGKPRPPIRRLLDANIAVLGVDLIYQGEFLPDGKPLQQARRVKNPREAAAYTFGYNPTVFAQRVHDVLTALRFARDRAGASGQVCLVGLNGAGAWAAAALAQADGAATKAAVDTAGFRFARVSDICAPDFLPGGAKYFDLPGMLALAAPLPLWLTGEGTSPPDVVAAAYKAQGKRAALTTTADDDGVEQAAVAWLIQ